MTDEHIQEPAETDEKAGRSFAANISKGIRGDDGQLWPRTMDASVWAEAWMIHYLDNPAIAGDASAMLGWFANAIMAGFDEAQRRAGANYVKVPLPTYPSPCR